MGTGDAFNAQAVLVFVIGSAVFFAVLIVAGVVLDWREKHRAR